MSDDDFRDGFIFALHVQGSLGDKADFDAIVAQLVSVARGQLSLQPSPDEAIRGIEADAGKPLPDILKQSVHRMLNSRKQTDATNQKFAHRMLALMGVDPEQEP